MIFRTTHSDSGSDIVDLYDFRTKQPRTPDRLARESSMASQFSILYDFSYNALRFAFGDCAFHTGFLIRLILFPESSCHIPMKNRLPALSLEITKNFLKNLSNKLGYDSIIRKVAEEP